MKEGSVIKIEEMPKSYQVGEVIVSALEEV